MSTEETVEEQQEVKKAVQMGRMNAQQSRRHTLSVLPKVARSERTRGTGTHKGLTVDQVFKELKYHKRVFVQHLGRFRKMHVREILEECESALFTVGVDHRGLHIEATHEILTLASKVGR